MKFARDLPGKRTREPLASASATAEPFEAMVRQHYSLLCAQAYRYVRSRDVAEDLVQEVLFRVWKQGDAIDFSNPVSYLLRAVHHEAMSWFRRHKRESSLDSVELPARSGTTVTSGVEEAEILQALADAIAELGPRSRQIFQLSRDEGLSYREISERLGLSIKTVETLMGRSLRILRMRAARFLTIVGAAALGGSLLR